MRHDGVKLICDNNVQFSEKWWWRKFSETEWWCKVHWSVTMQNAVGHYNKDRLWWGVTTMKLNKARHKNVKFLSSDKSKTLLSDDVTIVHSSASHDNNVQVQWGITMKNSRLRVCSYQTLTHRQGHFPFVHHGKTVHTKHRQKGQLTWNKMV